MSVLPLTSLAAGVCLRPRRYPYLLISKPRTPAGRTGKGIASGLRVADVIR